jgi:hypothetical protein
VCSARSSSPQWALPRGRGSSAKSWSTRGPHKRKVSRAYGASTGANATDGVFSAVAKGSDLLSVVVGNIFSSTEVCMRALSATLTAEEPSWRRCRH